MNENISWGKVAVLVVAIVGIGALGFVMGRKTTEQAAITPIAPVVQPTKKEVAMPVEKAEPVEAPSDEWKVYTDSRYEFAFEYPSFCKVDDGSGMGMIKGVHLNAVNSKDVCDFSVQYWEALNDVVVSDYPSLRKSVYDLSADSGLSDVKKTKFKGLDALVAVLENETGSLQEKVVYVQNGKHVYQISYVSRNLDQHFDGSVFEKILSTFNFTK